MRADGAPPRAPLRCACPPQPGTHPAEVALPSGRTPARAAGRRHPQPAATAQGVGISSSSATRAAPTSSAARRRSARRSVRPGADRRAGGRRDRQRAAVVLLRRRARPHRADVRHVRLDDHVDAVGPKRSCRCCPLDSRWRATRSSSSTSKDGDLAVEKESVPAAPLPSSCPT